jgi:hypothetical protein
LYAEGLLRRRGVPEILIGDLLQLVEQVLGRRSERGYVFPTCVGTPERGDNV